VKTNDYLAQGKYPIIDQGMEFIAGYVDDRELLCKVKAPCIIFGDHTKIVKFVDFEFVLGADGVKVLQPCEKLFPKYAYHYLKTVKFPEKTGYMRHFKYLKLTSIPIPPLDEQRRIAAILDKANEVKKSTEETQNMRNEFLSSVFLEMFGDPRQPMESIELSSIASVESGNGFPTDYQGETGKEFPFYKVSDMNLDGNEKYMINYNNSISRETVAHLKARIFPSGSVIFPKIGAAIQTNKKRITTRPCCVDNNVMGIIPTSKLSSEFLHTLMQFKDLSEFASSASPPSMRKTAVESWGVLDVSIELQLLFEQICDELNSVPTSGLRVENLIGSITQEMLA